MIMKATPDWTGGRGDWMSELSKHLLSAALLLSLSFGFAHAQSYPSKPIRLILPFPPGAPSDLVGRTVGQKMGEQMGQNLVPDNRTGAGGTVGLAVVAKSPPDGYTIMV